MTRRRLAHASSSASSSWAHWRIKNGPAFDGEIAVARLEGMTQPTADGQHQQRGVDQALNDRFVAAWHVVDSKLRLELSKEQLDFPAHRVDRRDCICGYRIGAGDVDAMLSGLGVPARNHS